MGYNEDITPNGVEETKENKSSKITNVVKKIFGKEEKLPLTAQMAWYCSKHGNGSYKELDARILDKQNQIDRTIRSKFEPIYSNGDAVTYSQSSYHCVVEIGEDLADVADEVFKPFVEAGFDVVDLTKECKSLSGDTPLYLISWLNAFKKKK